MGFPSAEAFVVELLVVAVSPGHAVLVIAVLTAVVSVLLHYEEELRLKKSVLVPFAHQPLYYPNDHLTFPQ